MELNPLTQINLITISAIIVIFLTTHFILRKIFFLPVIEVMEKRTARIEAAKAKRSETESLLEAAQLKSEAILTEAQEEAERIAEEAKGEMVKAREARIAQANAEADEILTKGRDEGQKLRQIEQAKLKEDLCVCVNLTLNKMIGKVDEKTVRYVANKALASKGIAG